MLLVRQDDGTPEERFFDWVYQPMRDDSGVVDGNVIVVFEVTELASARREAESANRAKDEFMAILGHELRNPLAPILTAVNLMRLRGDATLERERSVIERQAQHLVRLVDDMLDVSRTTTGKVELKRERLEIGEAVAKGLEMASPMLEQRQHRLTVNVPLSGLVVDGDPGRLAQVFSNLLTNAAKYTEAGGAVTVSATREDAPVEDADASPRADSRAKRASAVRPRVLIVDDNVDAADLLAEFLDLMGFTTRTAYDGPAALEIAAEFKPEVALLDIGLPAMDGYELAQLLRGQPGLSQVRLVAITGYRQEGDRRAAEDSGFNAHLVKPVDMERLRSLMQQMTSPETS